MSCDAMVGRDKAGGNFCHIDRSELDDLLDEILGDQLFLNNFAPRCKEEARGINGKQRDNTTLESGNEMTQQCRNRTSATDGTIATPSLVPQKQATMQMPVDSYRRSDLGRGSEPNPPRMYDLKLEESPMLTGGRNRAPSLPVNYAAFDRRRLQSVPCNDYNGQMQNSQNYYAAGSDRFVHGMCSEEPITWLDQQKMKLRTRQEGKQWMSQCFQQKQLMEELKSVQLLCAQKRAEHALLDNTIEQYAEYINSHSTQGQSSAREGLRCQACVPAMGNGNLGVKQPVSPSLSFQSEATNVSNEENKGLCKSERSYYVSGIERPPFTTHQTKYVFSVSSPHVSGANPGNMSPSVQLQKNSTKCSPLVPQRGESSREAMKQSNMMHDWELEQWEQESHTSLSSRSDATERSVVQIPNVEKTMAVGMWNAQHNTPVSAAAIQRDGAWSVGTSDDALLGANTPVKWSACNGDLRPTGRATYVASEAVPTKVPATISYSSGNVNTSSSAFMLHESSPNSALSTSYGLPPQNGDACLSRNRSESKALEAIPRPSPASSSFRPNASFSSFATSTLSQSGSVMPLAAIPTTMIPTAVASNGMAPYGMAPNDIVPNSMAPYGMAPMTMTPTAAAPNAVPQAAVVPNAMMPNVKVSTAVELAVTQTPTMPYNSFLTAKKKDDANANTTQNWQLASIAEQPSASETSEVISLRLIGPGMQKLEPDGTLPAVRPVTPKFPHPGMDGGLSFFSQTSSRVGQRRHSEDKLLDSPIYSGLRRATVTAYNQPSATSGTHSDVNGRGGELRPRSADILHDEEKPEKKIQRGRNAASDSQEMLQSSGSSGCSNSLPSAYHRTERLLSADFTLQGINRRTSASQAERSWRDARRQSEFDNTGRRPSEIHNKASHSKTDFPDGLDDVFANKMLPAVNGNKLESYMGKQEHDVYNLEMLDTALAGLQASANSPSDDSGPSQEEVLQSPQSGKTNPGFHTGQGEPQYSSGNLLQPFRNDPSTSADVSASLKTSHAPLFVQDSSKYWHKPNIARDEAIAYLKDKLPGTFIIRNSNSFPGAFGLALKVAQLPPNVHSRGGDPQAELVRHFLIEPTLKGVKLKGCSSEPVFDSLSALVYQHSRTALSLPCKLIIPDANNLEAMETGTAKSGTTVSEVLSQGAACNVVYINSVDMESLTGNEAINKAVAMTFKQNPAPLTTIVHFKVSSQGITLTDTNRRLFFRRHYPVDTVTFAGIDPEQRNWTWTNEETKASGTAKIFGFVARKQGSPMDNACHIFAELDADQPGNAIVEFIMKVMLGRGRSKQDSV